MHIPKIKGDEGQIFPIPAFTQLQPALNEFESKVQQMWCGVPNGLRNTVLWKLDQIDDRYKKYRIPSHNNPHYTYEYDQERLKEWGGENDDRYIQLSLGKHGSAAYQVIPRESIQVESYPFMNIRYGSVNKLKGATFQDVIQTPKLPECTSLVMAIDLGFVDPTLIQIIGKDKKNVWRTYVRYRLTRIDFNEQEKIIDYLADAYNIPKIILDNGPAGQGPAILHNLYNRDEYKLKKYNLRLEGVNFGERILAGFDPEGEEIFQDAKTYGGNQIATMIQNGELIFSEIDREGISQMERVAKQRGLNGKDRFFVLNDKGAGASDDDHIFASYICFVLGIRNEVIFSGKKKLGQSIGEYSKI